MKYLLDTNVVIRLLNSDPVVTARTRQQDRGEMGMSAIVLHELMVDAFKSRHPERNLGFLEELDFDVLDLQRRDAREAGRIRATLVARGAPIGRSPWHADRRSGAGTRPDPGHAQHAGILACPRVEGGGLGSMRHGGTDAPPTPTPPSPLRRS